MYDSNHDLMTSKLMMIVLFLTETLQPYVPFCICPAAVQAFSLSSMMEAFTIFLPGRLIISDKKETSKLLYELNLYIIQFPTGWWHPADMYLHLDLYLASSLILALASMNEIYATNLVSKMCFYFFDSFQYQDRRLLWWWMVDYTVAAWIPGDGICMY